MKQQNVNMTEGPLFSKMVTYTFSVMLTALLQLVYNVADSAVVGRFAKDGETAIAAIGSTSSICNLLLGLLLGLSVGVCVSVSQYLGAKCDRDVSEAVHTSVLSSVVFGIPLALIGFFAAEPLLILMKTPASVLPSSVLYMRIYFLGVPFAMVYNYSASILRAKGDTRFPLYILTGAGLVNVCLNIFFVIVFGMDVAGVALATLVSQALSAFLVIIRLHTLKDSCRLYFRRLRLHRDKLKMIFRIGLPAGIQGSMFSVSNVLIQSSYNALGPAVMTANTAAQNIDAFGYTAQNAVYHTTLAFVGQNMGARRMDRVRRIKWLALALVCAVGLTASAIEVIFGRQLLGIFGLESEEIISLAMLRLQILAATYVLCGMMEVFTGIMRGMGASLAPMLITLGGVCVFRVVWVLFIFPIDYFHNTVWLYLSYPISWTITLIAQVIACRVMMNKRERLMTMLS